MAQWAKNPALTLLWFWVQLWHGFHPLHATVQGEKKKQNPNRKRDKNYIVISTVTENTLDKIHTSRLQNLLQASGSKSTGCWRKDQPRDQWPGSESLGPSRCRSPVHGAEAHGGDGRGALWASVRSPTSLTGAPPSGPHHPPGAPPPDARSRG